MSQASQPRRVIIKVLSGAHSNAESYVWQSPAIIGSSMGADIILHDQSIVNEHCEVHFDETTISLRVTQQESTLYCQGVPVEDGFEFNQVSIFNLGLIFVAIGYEDNNWNQVPPLAELEYQTFTSHSEPLENDATIDNDNDDIDKGSSDESDITHEGEQKSAGEQRQKSEDASVNEMSATKADSDKLEPKKRSRFSLIRALILIILILSCGVGYYLVLMPTVAPASTKSIDFNALAVQNNIDGSVEKQGNRVLVRGVVLTSKDKNNFVTTLKDHGYIISVDLTIAEYVRNNIQQSFDQLLAKNAIGKATENEVKINVDKANISNFTITGYVQDEQDWQKLYSQIIVDNNRVKFHDYVYHWSDGHDYLKQLLDTSGLGKYTAIEEDKTNNQLVINILRRTIDHQELQAVQNEYRQKYPKPHLKVLKSKAKVLHRPTFRNAKIVGVGLNDVPYIKFDNGKRYFLGGITPEGYKIEQITESAIVFKRKGKTYLYRLEAL